MNTKDRICDTCPRSDDCKIKTDDIANCGWYWAVYRNPNAKYLCLSCIRANNCKNGKYYHNYVVNCKEYVPCSQMPKTEPPKAKSKPQFTPPPAKNTAPAKQEVKQIGERDKLLLASIDDMIQTAPKFGICPLVFKNLKEEVLFIMGERDGLKASAKAAKI